MAKVNRFKRVGLTLVVAWLVILCYIFCAVHSRDQRSSFPYFAAYETYIYDTTNSHWVTLPNIFDLTTHNKTVRVAGGTDRSSNTLPGLFWEQRLWLLGVRLTTSYEDSDSSTFLTVFGMPGDFHSRVKGGEIRCPPIAWYNGDNGTILSYPQAHTQGLLFASLSDGRLFPLEFLKSVSGDANQNNNTLIWHGVLPINNIGERASSSPSELALRVTLHACFKSQGKSKAVPILTVDIPLSTGVVGQAGPQIVGSTNENAREAALCVCIYGDDAIHYLPEFILHHTNLGFGPVIVGIIDASIGSTRMQHVHGSLRDFVDQGLVDIAAMGLPSPFEPALECEVNVRKQHFYNSCLYHAKGRTPYVGIWDIDEFWLPPIAKGNSKAATENNNKHPFSNRGNADDVWATSNYSKSFSVGRAMRHIQVYHEYFGCGESWCYHAFPSWPVWLRRQPQYSNDLAPDTQRGLILEDFQLRAPVLDSAWSKSIIRTKYAFMGGIHQAGSCRFPSTNTTFASRKEVAWADTPYERQTQQHPANEKWNCGNLILGRFGAMHHFRSLNRVRSSEMGSFQRRCLGHKGSGDSDKGCVEDEYIGLFGETVRQQLDARSKRFANAQPLPKRKRPMNDD